MHKLTRSKERVAKHGEVFTPEHIVHSMHNLDIMKDNWGDHTMIYLEPTCGHGNFVEAAVQKKLDAGLTAYQAVNTVFGMDIMEDNIEDCQRRVFHLVRPYAKGDKKKEQELRCVIVNNIFHVEDSLAFIREGKWDDKKFFAIDPTEVGGQMLSKEEQKKVSAHITEKEILL